jgi:1-acyl-sn-glycerol-3-phosphate acyltransferase
MVGPDYPLPIGLVARLFTAIVLRQHINFAQQARRYTSRLYPQIAIMGRENIPTSGPCLITINHYSRPGFNSWWLALSVSAVVPVNIRWIITGAWTFLDHKRARYVTPITEAIFPQIAWCLDFYTMPPMPPRPQDLNFRTQTVRRVLHQTQEKIDKSGGLNLVIGIAPEGSDYPDGVLGHPPPGVGRFIEQLAKIGLEIVPVGIFEEGGRLCLNFGVQYKLTITPGISRRESDLEVSRVVMERIAARVPEQLGYWYG